MAIGDRVDHDHAAGVDWLLARIGRREAGKPRHREEPRSGDVAIHKSSRRFASSLRRAAAITEHPGSFA